VYSATIGYGEELMVITWAAWFGIYLVIQGIYIFREGVVAPFFLETTGRSQCSTWTRFMTGLVHLAGGAGLLAITSEAIAHRVGGIQIFDVIAIIVFVLPGILFLTRPVTILEWARSAHPEISTSNSASLMIARVVGAGLLLLGLRFVALQ
jgi:hypothetical protein